MSNFDRPVYCIAGLPFDAVDMNQAVSAVRDAKYRGERCFMSTPNMNFVANAVEDPEFLKSVIYSDIVVADGSPIVWMAKLLGIPIRQRVAGSSLFEMLKSEKRRTLKVYFMGGLDGVAEEASEELNRTDTGLVCVGHYNPGFGTVDQMSTDEVIANINASNADFLVVALGAKKGQAWILKNLDKITIPLVSHLGAVINFESKRIQRAPSFMQNTGFEWVWRIKEEPELWRRYFRDGVFFLNLLAKKVLPLKFWFKKNKSRLIKLKPQTTIEFSLLDNKSIVHVRGAVFDEAMTPELRAEFKQVSEAGKSVDIDLSGAEYVSAGFLGLVLLLKKELDQQALEIRFVNCNETIARVIYWTGMSYLKG